MDFFARIQRILFSPLNASHAKQLLIAYAVISMGLVFTWTYLIYVQKINQAYLLAGLIGFIACSFFLKKYPASKAISQVGLFGLSIILALLILDFSSFIAFIQSRYVLMLSSVFLFSFLFLWLKTRQQTSQLAKLNHQLLILNATNSSNTSAEEKLEVLEKKLQLTIQEFNSKLQQKESYILKLQDEVLQSNKDLELFAYVASHDLQEPLRMVGNFVQLLEKEYHSKIDKNGKEYIHYAVDGVNRMSKLINALLQFSRVGRRFIELNSANPEAIVRNALIYIQSQKRDTEIIFNISDFPQEMHCESRQLGIVFLHLLSNAIKFNRAEQIVVGIWGEERAEDYLFVVEDNGIGIDLPHGKETHIFEIFKKLNRKEDFEGSGIGLSLCQKIIKRHNGKIWYETTKGKGSRFYFTISKDIPVYGNEEQQEIESSLFFQN